MKVKKKVIADLAKCYAIAPLFYKGEMHFMVAAEKIDRCLLFDLKGQVKDTIWSEPGGVMTMVQVPGSDGQFLATHKFYSPNDSKDAKIVIVTPDGKGSWEVQTLVSVPHVHRFDIISKNGVNYLIVCALKSGHEYKDDWSMPGKVYAAQLPDDLSGYNEEHQLQLAVIKDHMLKNHGYSKYCDEEGEKSLITCEQGVFLFTPPMRQGRDWTIETLLNEPTSDAVLIDLDGDGSSELCTISPFHGERVTIFKKRSGVYQEEYVYPQAAEFAHAIWGARLGDKPAFIVGHRQGKRRLMAIIYDQTTGSYTTKTIDQGCGPANVYHYTDEGNDIVIAANRETDEVAMYEIEN